MFRKIRLQSIVNTNSATSKVMNSAGDEDILWTVTRTRNTDKHILRNSCQLQCRTSIFALAYLFPQLLIRRIRGRYLWGEIFNEVNFPIYKENKDITLNTISSHISENIDMKPSRGDRPGSNLGPEGCDKLPGVTSCQLWPVARYVLLQGCYWLEGSEQLPDCDQ